MNSNIQKTKRSKPKITLKKGKKIESVQEPKITLKKVTKIKSVQKPKISLKKKERIESVQKPKISLKKGEKIESVQEPQISLKKGEKIESVQKPQITLPKKHKTTKHKKQEKDTITFDSIDKFYQVGNKNNNGSDNKIRENIIRDVINKNIPESYYEDEKWLKLKTTINDFITELYLEHDTGTINSVSCLPKGGRKYHYDFEITINNHKFKVEFKYNIDSLDKAPQFVNLHKPSQYLNDNYEEYYYDNYLVDLAKKFNIECPDRNKYLSSIHGTKPACIKAFQDRYYKGAKSSSRYTGKEDDIYFYDCFIKASKDSIKNFIDQTDLLKQKLSDYLFETQKDKYYMLYKDGNINLYFRPRDYYEIESYEKTSNSYIVTTKLGMKLKILLRWKNGNGIAYPAFQIS